MDSHPSDPGAIYRSGVAARLAGLSAQTLRVWERRYNLSNATRSARGQRMYSAEQVQRLRLLKQLVDQGHAISALAPLPDTELQALSGTLGSASTHAQPIQVALVGTGLIKRVALSSQQPNGFIVQHSWDRLDRITQPKEGARIELLLIEQSELDESTLPIITNAQAVLPSIPVVVLYRFCSSATIRALRTQGCLVARMPSDFEEIITLCHTALKGERLPANDAPTVPSVRFADEQLTSITTYGNRIQCECPRHLADLLLMINSFERYSAQCASRNEADARLHLELQRAAGLSRAILEEAMEKLLRAEGLPLA